mgnify:CR=1 FL=1
MIEGPGVPALAIGCVAFAAAHPWRRGAPLRPLLGSLAIAFGVSFGILAFGSQRAGAALVLPILAIAALGLAACVFGVAGARARAVLAALLVSTGAHHLGELTLGFDPDPAAKSGLGPFGPAFPLWNHQDMLSRIVGESWRERRWSGWLDAVADRLASAPLGRRPIIQVLSQNPYFSPGNLELAGLLRHEDWWVLSVPLNPGEPFDKGRDEIEKSVLYADAFVMRRRPRKDEGVFDQMVRVAVDPIVGSAAAGFTPLGEPIPFIEGETLQVYRRRPDLTWRVTTTDYPIRAGARFVNPNNPANANIHLPRRALRRRRGASLGGAPARARARGGGAADGVRRHPRSRPARGRLAKDPKVVLRARPRAAGGQERGDRAILPEPLGAGRSRGEGLFAQCVDGDESGEPMGVESPLQLDGSGKRVVFLEVAGAVR